MAPWPAEKTPLAEGRLAEKHGTARPFGFALEAQERNCSTAFVAELSASPGLDLGRRRGRRRPARLRRAAFPRQRRRPGRGRPAPRDQVLPLGTAVALDLSAPGCEFLGDTNTAAVTLLSVKARLLTSDAASAVGIVVGGATIDPWSAPFGAATTGRRAARWPLVLQSGRGLAGGCRRADSPAGRRRRRRDLLGGHRGHPDRGCFRLGFRLGRLISPTRERLRACSLGRPALTRPKDESPTRNRLNRSFWSLLHPPYRAWKMKPRSGGSASPAHPWSPAPGPGPELRETRNMAVLSGKSGTLYLNAAEVTPVRTGNSPSSTATSTMPPTIPAAGRSERPGRAIRPARSSSGRRRRKCPGG